MSWILPSIAIALSVATILILTLYRKNEGRSLQLIPFNNVWVAFHQPVRQFWFLFDVFSNIGLFLPLGMLLGLLAHKKIFNLVVICALFSTAIECTQFITERGHTDINDVIFNTVGAFLGIIIVRMWQKLVGRREILIVAPVMSMILAIGFLAVTLSGLVGPTNTIDDFFAMA